MIKYFIVFLDILICLCILFFARGMKWEKDKAAIIGFLVMIFSYLASVYLILI